MAADVAEMEAMVVELLELERLRDGRGLTKTCCDVALLLADVAEPFSGRPPGVAVTAADRTRVVVLDEDRMRTVLRNLLDNAFKYSLPDSQPVAISVTDDGPRVSISVRDDGPGIPEGDLANLFEPFFRVDRSRSKKTGGYGLGLSICKRIVDAHGGVLTVTNSAPRGAVFTVTLPRE
jgi:signal transduction histidine kinase